MADQRYSFVDLLSSSKDRQALIDPQVAEASNRLNLEADEVTLAGACMGFSVEAIDRLLQSGVLPGSLPPEKQDELSADLGVNRFDLAQGIAHNRELVVRFLGLPVPKHDTITPLPSSAEPKYPLFPHQRRALQQVRRLLNDGCDRAILHMPTGAGKTRTAMNLVCDQLRHSEHAAVLWIASTKELLEQGSHEFARAWSCLGNREVAVHTAWGGRQIDIKKVTDGLLVASPQTLYSRLKTSGPSSIGQLGRNIQLIVFDEAHQAIAATYREIIERLSAAGQPVTPIVGLTATPGRTFAKTDQDDALASFFGHTKVMLDTSAEGGPTNPVDYLINHEYLAQTDFVLLGELPENNVDDVIFETDDTVELGMDIANYLDTVAKATLNLVSENHTRILVFAASVELGRTLACILRAAGINANAVDAQSEPAVRDTLIREYKSRTPDPRVLVNYGVLTTGFDAPQTSAAVIARPTKSLVLYSQMVGRAIRGTKANGNKNAKVVTVVDPTVSAFGSIAEAFTHWNNYWEDQSDR